MFGDILGIRNGSEIRCSWLVGLSARITRPRKLSHVICGPSSRHSSVDSGQWTGSWRPVAPRKRNSSSQEPGLAYRQKASDSSNLMQTYSGCSDELNGTPLFWHSPLSTRVWGGTRRTASLERCPANARMTVEVRQNAGGKALESRSAVCVRSLRLG